MFDKKILIVGSGVAGICAATKLVLEGYPGGLIMVVDKGKDPYDRGPDEIMEGFAGAGLFSDGKISYLSDKVGGHLTKYCGEKKAQELVDELMEYLKEFHPDPKKIMYSAPLEEPEFIKPYFELKMAPTYHIGTNYLHEMGKEWYRWLVDNHVNFYWEHEVISIDFNTKEVFMNKGPVNPGFVGFNCKADYDYLIYCTGKSGMRLTSALIEGYGLETEQKPAQIGVRFEAPQKYFQRILDVAYDFKLYRKVNNKISLRTFCTNANAAYIAQESNFCGVSYNGHSFKDESMRNDMVNFGIIMEVKGVNDPLKWTTRLVSECNAGGAGIFFSPKGTRQPTKMANGKEMKLEKYDDMNRLKMNVMISAYFNTFHHIEKFIEEMDKIFKFGDDYCFYAPEIKFLTDEPLVDYNDLSLINYPDVFMCGDALSARGIAVSGAQGIYVAEGLVRKLKEGGIT